MGLDSTLGLTNTQQDELYSNQLSPYPQISLQQRVREGWGEGEGVRVAHSQVVLASFTELCEGEDSNRNTEKVWEAYNKQTGISSPVEPQSCKEDSERALELSQLSVVGMAGMHMFPWACSSPKTLLVR